MFGTMSTPKSFISKTFEIVALIVQYSGPSILRLPMGPRKCLILQVVLK